MRRSRFGRLEGLSAASRPLDAHKGERSTIDAVKLSVGRLKRLGLTSEAAPEAAAGRTRSSALTPTLRTRLTAAAEVDGLVGHVDDGHVTPAAQLLSCSGCICAGHCSGRAGQPGLLDVDCSHALLAATGLSAELLDVDLLFSLFACSICAGHENDANCCRADILDVVLFFSFFSCSIYAGD